MGAAWPIAAVKHVEAGGWVLDSGASHHITNDASTMSDMRPLDDDIHITFANGERAEARGIGSVQLGGLTGAAFDYIHAAGRAVRTRRLLSIWCPSCCHA